MRQPLLFNHDDREDVALADGSTVQLRAIRSGDKQRLRDLLAAMSPRSRVMRFFHFRGDYSERELSYLSELDGVDHFALLAVRGDETLGEARFVRLAEDGAAEPAFAVADRAQGLGLGRILVARLAEAARDRGIARFEAQVLPENHLMLRLFHGLDPSVPLRPSPTLDEVPCSIDLFASARRIGVAA